jgi:SAM-dependent methyltransferase
MLETLGLRRWALRAHSAWMDLRVGGRLLQGVVVNPAEAQGFENAENSDYETIGRLFSKIRLLPSDVVVDVGCGKGRLFNWLLARKLPNRMIGVEILPEVAEFARTRLKRFKQVQIITGNILENFPEDATVFYLFNPFSEALTRQFASRLEAHAVRLRAERGGRVVVIYWNCLNVKVFEENPFWQVRKSHPSSWSRAEAAIIEPAVKSE